MNQGKLRWRGLGPIKANTALGNVPNEPGAYKLTFHLWGKTYSYIGEAGARGLRARIRDHANTPTEGSKVEHLLYDLLKEAGEAELSVCCIGMDVEKARRQFEREAIAEAARQRVICINKPGYSGDVSMQRFVLQSEVRMLAKELEHVRAKLAKLNGAAASNSGLRYRHVTALEDW